MKKKITSILLTIVCLLAFSLNAQAAKVAASNSLNNQGEYTLTNSDGLKSGKYAVANFNSVRAYCIDPGKNPVGNGTKCDSSTAGMSEDFVKAAKYIFSSNKSESQKGTAIRIVAIATGDGAFGYKNDTKAHINAKCSYIAAAYKAANAAGYTVKSTGLTSYKSYAGTNCASKFEVKGDVINFATDALRETKKESASDYVKPTATISYPSAGVAVLKIDNPKQMKVDLTINCTKAKGDCGSFTITEKTKSFRIETETNNGEQCGTFNATMKYTGGKSDYACSEITKYECGPLQDYVGCSKKNESGSDDTEGKLVTEVIKDEDNNPEIPLRCDETPKKKECTVTEKPAIKTLDGDAGKGLCTGTGATVIDINEASVYTKSRSDVENCVIDNKEFLVSKSASGLCATYCVEDYKFESSGLELSLTDKDGSDFIITSGSYFNFKDATAKETGTVKCYTKVDMDAFGKGVLNAAKNFASQMSETQYTCDSTTDESGNTVWTLTKTVFTWEPSYNKSTFSVSFNERKDVTTSTSTTKPDNCGKVETKFDEANAATYRKAVENLTVEIAGCVNNAKAYKADDACHSEVIFDYGYNMKPFTIPAKSIKNEQNATTYSNCNGNFGSGTCTNGSRDIEVDLGFDTAGKVSFNTVEYIENIINVEYDYSFEGVGICNNYNEGTTTYLNDGTTTHDITESECLAKDGTTFVKGWPISYDTPAGVYSYEITVQGYGHISKNGKCYGLEKYGKDKVSYGCEYKVNCRDCPFECDPEAQCDPSEDELCKGDCPWECAGMGCIADPNAGLVLDYKPISLIDVDASLAYLNERYNGVTSVARGRKILYETSKVATTGTGTQRSVDSINWGTTKGKATINKIDEQGEDIYSGTNNTLEYSVTLTPKDIKNIKEDNNKSGKNYLDGKLNCVNDSKYPKYVYCTSEFLDELESKHILTVRNNRFISAYDIPADIIPIGEEIQVIEKSKTGPAWK